MEIVLGWLERLGDTATVTLAATGSYYLYRVAGAGHPVAYHPQSLLACSAAFAVLVVLLLEKHGDYRPYISLLAVRETERLLRVTAEGVFLTLLVAFFAATRVPRLFVGIGMVMVPASLAVEKWVAHQSIRWLRSRGRASRRAVILGAGPLGRAIYSARVRSPKFGVEPVAFVDEEAAYNTSEVNDCSYNGKKAARVLAGPLSERLFRNLQASVLVVAEPNLDECETQQILMETSAAGVSTYIASEEFLRPGYWIEYSELDGHMLVHFSKGRVSATYKVAKRVMDIVCAFFGLVAFSVPMSIIALVVKLTSPGPSIFVQKRVGEDGRLFNIAKFRSMYADAPPYALSPTANADPRITPVGRFLRRTRLDELPQLVNVLLGEMSLVGPRPEMPHIVSDYTPLQRQRLSVKPGMTGLWQLSTDRHAPIHHNPQYDLYYVRYRNLFMDVAILLHSVIFAARGI